MKLFGKKGTDKPIEIFIALFVILAVAMVILKMFSTQIAQKQNEMARQQEIEKIKQAKSDLNIFCEQLCTEATTMKDKINFCKSYYYDKDEMSMDLNGNSMLDYTDKLGTEAYCEDRIYCASYKPCKGSLNVRNCKKLVCDYFSTEYGINQDMDKAIKLVGYDSYSETYTGWFQPGSCWGDISAEERKDHWFTYFMKVPDLNDQDTTGAYQGGQCFFKEGTCLTTYTQILNEFGGYSYTEWENWCPPTSLV